MLLNELLTEYRYFDDYNETPEINIHSTSRKIAVVIIHVKIISTNEELGQTYNKGYMFRRVGNNLLNSIANFTDITCFHNCKTNFIWRFSIFT